MKESESYSSALHPTCAREAKACQPSANGMQKINGMQKDCCANASQQPHQVQWETTSTASKPVPMLRPAVLNCSLL